MIKKFVNIIGLMSGTSLDGIDISLTRTNGEELINKENFYYKYNKKEKNKLLQILQDKFKIINNKKLLSKADEFITKLHIKSINKFCFNKKFSIIGFHGQTIYHNAEKRISLQLGDPILLSKTFKRKVVFDFRSIDLKSGGQGAPLAPIYHKFVIEKFKYKLPACIINIGGVANMTFWDGKNLIGFDTGPGNCLIDNFMKEKFKLDFDNNGEIARKGNVINLLLKKILKNSYFLKKPPKSLDRDYFNEDLKKIINFNFNLEDILNTLTEITALSINNSFKFLPSEPKSIYICGGGSKNKYLVDRINKIFKQTEVKVITNHDTNFIESELMAYLAARRIYDLPITFPSTTGIKSPSTGGHIFF
tara:strand:- start:444 stop:1529 length:1086 start_codon:yes stop_codon:yes gene_type:complete